MANACIILKKTVNADMGATFAVFDAFAVGGYTFDEIRVISEVNGQTLAQMIADLKKKNKLLLLLSSEDYLSNAKKCVMHSFGGELLKDVHDACIFRDGETFLCLLSSQQVNASVEFVKNICVPYFRENSGGEYACISLRAIGANASVLEEELSKIEKASNGCIRCKRSSLLGDDVISLVYEKSIPKPYIDDVVRELLIKLGDTVYALNDNSIEMQLVELLKLRRAKISVAESFTGGGIAKRITSIPGASAIYFEGINTYNELSKVKRLGVSVDTLNKFGAVSERTAYEMALGLLNTGDCDLALATTGLAGPQSDRSGLPVGLCFIAVGTSGFIQVYRHIFEGDRRTITEKAINYALHHAYKAVKGL